MLVTHTTFRVQKVIFVIHSQMLVGSICPNHIIGSSAIRHDDTAWLNSFTNNRQKCDCCSIRYCNHKNFSGVPTNSPENPPLRKRPSSVVFALCKQSFIISTIKPGPPIFLLFKSQFAQASLRYIHLLR